MTPEIEEMIPSLLTVVARTPRTSQRKLPNKQAKVVWDVEAMETD